MPVIDQVVVQGLVAADAAAITAPAKGKALEDLICYIFEQVPGISITRRNQLNAFHNEEIDVAFFNDRVPTGFFFLPDLILIEAKNWSARVGSVEVSWFDRKIESRGLPFGILVAKNGVTGNAEDLTAAHQTIALGLAKQRRLIVITVAELIGLADTDELVALVKSKLCDLALKGTII